MVRALASKLALHRILVGLLAIPVVALWNRLVTARSPVPEAGRATTDAAVTEHERGWVDYLRGFDAHHGPEGSPDARPAEGSLRRGLRLWVEADFLRGYTLGDDVYVLRGTPTVVRIHQAGHTPTFGAVFEPLADEYRSDGGLPDEPLHTLDVMLPGEFPHTLLRLRDRRGLRGAYRAWLHDGRIDRVRE